MSNERLMMLSDSTASTIVNWREIINEINIELNKDNTLDYRCALLDMLKSTFQLVEVTIAEEDLDLFRTTNRKVYISHLVEESLVGENVCTETINSVLDREVEAGRMKNDDELRLNMRLALYAPHHSRTELMNIANNQKLLSEKKNGIFDWLKVVC